MQGRAVASWVLAHQMAASFVADGHLSWICWVKLSITRECLIVQRGIVVNDTRKSATLIVRLIRVILNDCVLFEARNSWVLLERHYGLCALYLRDIRVQRVLVVPRSMICRYISLYCTTYVLLAFLKMILSSSVCLGSSVSCLHSEVTGHMGLISALHHNVLLGGSRLPAQQALVQVDEPWDHLLHPISPMGTLILLWLIILIDEALIAALALVDIPLLPKEIIHRPVCFREKQVSCQAVIATTGVSRL